MAFNEHSYKPPECLESQLARATTTNKEKLKIFSNQWSSSGTSHYAVGIQAAFSYFNINETRTNGNLRGISLLSLFVYKDFKKHYFQDRIDLGILERPNVWMTKIWDCLICFYKKPSVLLILIIWFIAAKLLRNIHRSWNLIHSQPQLINGQYMTFFNV